MKNVYQITFVILSAFITASCTNNTSRLIPTLNVQKHPPSELWTMSVDVEHGGSHSLELQHNSPKKIFSEIQSRQVMHMIALSSGLTQEELNKIAIVFDSEYLWIDLYSIGSNKSTIDRLYGTIKLYVGERSEGHTKEFLAAVMSNKKTPESIDDSDLKNLLKIHPHLPPTWLKKVDEKMVELIRGKVRQVNFVAIDGDIAWCYPILYNPDGTFKECFWDSGRYDAKEFDPKYKSIIEEVNQRVSDEMEREKIFGIHSFWERKKEYLKKQGIDWKSQSELNPYSSYD